MRHTTDYRLSSPTPSIGERAIVAAVYGLLGVSAFLEHEPPPRSRQDGSGQEFSKLPDRSQLDSYHEETPLCTGALPAARSGPSSAIRRPHTRGD